MVTLGEAFRRILAEHGRVNLDDLPAVVDELVDAVPSISRRDLVRKLTTPIADHHANPCRDGARCVWCPAEKVADALIRAGLVQVSRRDEGV